MIAIGISLAAACANTDRARADPSSGSVPVPSSSRRISELEVASPKILTTRPIWDENVETDRSIDCESPISA